MRKAVIYVVTEGEYSDYGIRAVFSTRLRADRYVAVLESGARVEEYALDEWVGAQRGPQWTCVIDLKSGVLSSRRLGRWLRHPRRCEIFPGASFIRVVSPVSAAHAQKVAVEERQRWLRERARGAKRRPR